MSDDTTHAGTREGETATIELDEVEPMSGQPDMEQQPESDPKPTSFVQRITEARPYFRQGAGFLAKADEVLLQGCYLAGRNLVEIDRDRTEFDLLCKKWRARGESDEAKLIDLMSRDADGKSTLNRKRVSVYAGASRWFCYTPSVLASLGMADKLCHALCPSDDRDEAIAAARAAKGIEEINDLYRDWAVENLQAGSGALGAMSKAEGAKATKNAKDAAAALRQAQEAAAATRRTQRTEGLRRYMSGSKARSDSLKPEGSAEGVSSAPARGPTAAPPLAGRSQDASQAKPATSAPDAVVVDFPTAATGRPDGRSPADAETPRQPVPAEPQAAPLGLRPDHVAQSADTQSDKSELETLRRECREAFEFFMASEPDVADCTLARDYLNKLSHPPGAVV